MTGAKTNERPGTRAQVRYLRVSPFKARVVLDLIRGKHVGQASEILTFSERGVSKEIAKLLASAIANAEHNDDLPAEELYISACYADEGPTLKRFRPRARGRAGRIAKRTCHITIIVSRLSDEELDALRSRASSRGTTRDAAAARRERVARSRQTTGVSEAVEENVVDTTSEVETAEVETAEVETAEVETAEVETAEAGVPESDGAGVPETDGPETDASEDDDNTTAQREGDA
jgi:large subunit ribosomal protein L22